MDVSYLLDSLNDKQREAVAAPRSNLLVLAGAGSGKTRVLVHRIAWLMSVENCSPYSIMAVTFTNKAAAEMRHRIGQLMGTSQGGMWVGTFHGLAHRLLRAHHMDANLPQDFQILDSEDQLRLLKRLIKAMNLDEKQWPPRQAMWYINSQKDEGLRPHHIQSYGNPVEQTWQKVYQAYQEACDRAGLVDFAELLLRAHELWLNKPHILQHYRERFTNILVDEFQDTNNIQYAWIRLLAGDTGKVMIVGDDDQSIYGWRGAQVENIQRFLNDFPGAETIRLEQNYRSTKNILNAANQVIANNTERKAKTLWTENEEGSKVHFRQFLNAYEEAEYVAGEIGKLKRNGLGNYRDCAILYRTNAQSRIFEEKFIAANIPYKLVGGVNFYARKEIKDLLCYLKTINNARDDLAVQRIINVPKRGIGATTLGRVQDYADNMGISLYEALRVAEEVPSIGRSLSKIDGFVTFIQMLKSKADVLTVEEILQEVIDSTGYVAELEAENTEESRARIENIDELISKTVAYQEAMEEQNQPATLSGFLEEVALVADIDTVDPDQDYVLLMTLHSAKGLEFPKVFMVGMEDGIFPSHMTISYGDDGEMEEERRLCYVGITRAMKDLTLTCAQQRMIRGETQYNRVSRFVREIPRELVDLGHTIQEKKPKVEELIPTPAKYSKMKEILQGRNYKPREFKVTKANSLDYEVGDTVRHIKFGVGIVKEIVEGGRDYEVTVEFDKVGVKKMFASFAKLKKI